MLHLISIIYDLMNKIKKIVIFQHIFHFYYKFEIQTTKVIKNDKIKIHLYLLEF